MKLIVVLFFFSNLAFAQYSNTSCLTAGMVSRPKLTDADGIGWMNTSDHSIMYYNEKPFYGIIGACDGDELVYKAYVANGVQHGEEVGYQYNGELQFKRNWVDGVLQGEEIVYTNKGDTLYAVSYKNGRYDGRLIKYSTASLSDNGVQFILNFKNGRLDGDFVWYNEDGVLRRAGHFISGNKDGEELTYDWQGNLSSKKVYSAGKLVSCKGYCPDPGIDIDEIESNLEYELRHIIGYIEGLIRSNDY